MLTAYHRIAENRYQERHGLDFEDFVPGQRFRHRPGVTLSQQDNADEALDTLNGAMLHYDAHYAAATVWQRPLMVTRSPCSGWLVWVARPTAGAGQFSASTTSR